MVKNILSKFKKRDKQTSNNNSLSGDAELIIITEKILPDMKSSLQERGLPVVDIYNNIEDAKIGLLLRANECRVVIIERGLGIFNTTSMRVELTDLLGMCDGVSKKATVFYTDELLKSDNIKITKANKIDWKPYKGTVNILEELKKYNEVYVSNNSEQSESLNNSLNFKGKLVDDKVKTKVVYRVDIDEENDILEKTCSGIGEELPLFDVKY